MLRDEMKETKNRIGAALILLALLAGFTAIINNGPDWLFIAAAALYIIGMALIVKPARSLNKDK